LADKRIKRIIVLRDDMRRQRALNVIRDIKIDPDHLFEVILQYFHVTRSLAANRLLWWWYKQIRNHLKDTTGKMYSDRQLHHHFCELFLPQVTEEVLGKVHTRQQTSSDLNVKQFSEFLTNIEQYCFDVLHFSFYAYICVSASSAPLVVLEY